MGYILRLSRDSGKENGNYRDDRDYIGLIRGCIGYIVGLYGDNGKENGNYYNIIRCIMAAL